jgi:hypothetical protein
MGVKVTSSMYATSLAAAPHIGTDDRFNSDVGCGPTCRCVQAVARMLVKGGGFTRRAASDRRSQDLTREKTQTRYL